jgi:hypothetical protein
MERDKLNLLSHVFVELTDEKQSGVLEMSKSLLQAQRHSKALIDERDNSKLAQGKETADGYLNRLRSQ